MSSKNNVNPDHYKTGGRDRAGDDVPAGTPRVSGSKRSPAARKKGGGPPPNLIPGAPPVGERPHTEDED
jgi:hypothetical protein